MRTWRDKLIAVVDTETTGLDPAVDCVVEIGVAIAALEDGGARVVQARSWLVRPRGGRAIPEAATAVHGITDADAAKGGPFPEVLAAVVALVGPDAVLAGYNARFDRAMLIAGCLADGCPVPYWLTGGERGAWIDVLAWAQAHEPYARGKGRHKLGAVAARLGVEVSTAHRAAGDAETAARVLGALAIARIDGGDPMPDDLDALVLWQRVLTAERDANFLRWLVRQPPITDSTPKDPAA